MKKKLLYFIFLFSFTFCKVHFAWGQINLVPNPSFEQFSTCPINGDQVPYAIGWDNYGDSPDYFNACSLNPEFSVPHNWGGYQQAASGNAYCAFGTYTSLIYGSYRDNIGAQLSSPLSIGTKYYVSIKVSLSLDSAIQANCATDKIGVKFSTIPYTWYNPPPKSNNPQIYATSIITDTINWTRVFGAFIADSTYKYIVVGNFFDDNNTDTLIMDASSNCYYAYYFLDDICVSNDSLFSLNYTYTSVSELLQENISIYPNPVSDNINIDLPALEVPCEIKIHNILGKEIFFKPNVNISHILIDISNIKESILILTIKNKDHLFNYKLLKL